MKDIDEILRYFPNKIYEIFFNLFKENDKIVNELQEIRMRTNRPILLKLRERDLILQYNISQAEILQILEKLCNSSIYAYKNQICEGFITVKGGHRVGISGSCAIENGKVINIKYIYSLNFRIARQVIGSSNPVLRHILNLESNSIYDTLIVSAPGTGKTTILRDIIRQLATGIKEIKFLAIK